MAARATTVAESNQVATDGGSDDIDHSADPVGYEEPDFDRGPSGVDEL